MELFILQFLFYSSFVTGFSLKFLHVSISDNEDVTAQRSWSKKTATVIFNNQFLLKKKNLQCDLLDNTVIGSSGEPAVNKLTDEITSRSSDFCLVLDVMCTVRQINHKPRLSC